MLSVTQTTQLVTSPLSRFFLGTAPELLPLARVVLLASAL